MPYQALNFSRMADKISQFGADQSKAIFKKRIDTYRDCWEDYLLEELRRQFTKKTWKRLKLLTSTEFNIIKRVTNETSMVYKNPAVREAIIPTEGEKQTDENYSKMIADSDINSVMPMVNRMTNLTNNTLVRPVVRKGRMEVDLHTLDNAEVIVDPDDWKKIIGVKYYTGLDLPESYTYNDPAAVTKKPWEMSGEVSIDKAPISSYDRSVIIMLEDRDEDGNYSRCMLYEFMRRDGKEIEAKEPEQLEYYDKDGHAVLPFIMFWREYPIDQLIDYTTGSDLYDANMTFAVNLTHLRYLQKFQSYKLITWRTRDKSKMPSTLTLDPGTVTVEEDSEGAGNTGLEVADIQANLKEFWGTLKDTLTTFLTQYNISPANFTMSASPQSGFSARVNDKGKMESRQAQLPIYAEREKELFDVMRIVWNADMPNDRINEEAEFMINFGEIDYPLSPDEEMKQDAFDLTNNIVTPIDIIMRNDPDLTREQAEQKYIENQAFNSSQRATLRPPEQPGNNADSNIST